METNINHSVSQARRALINTTQLSFYFVLLSFFLMTSTIYRANASNKSPVDSKIMREIKAFAKRNGITINKSKAVIDYLEGSHFQVTVPSVTVDQDRSENFNELELGVVYLSSATRSSNNDEIPKGIYVMKIVKKNEKMVSQFIQNGNVIAEGEVFPPCTRGEQASVGGPVIHPSSAGIKTSNNFLCATRCSFFLQWCQVNTGGYCGETFYWCGFCFGLW